MFMIKIEDGNGGYTAHQAIGFHVVYMPRDSHAVGVSNAALPHIGWWDKEEQNVALRMTPIEYSCYITNESGKTVEALHGHAANLRA